MRMTKWIGLGITLGLAASLEAAPIIGGRITVQNDGAVSATYLAGFGLYSDDLLLYLPSNGFGVIFNNKTTASGTVFDLGQYAAGTELEFQIHVLNTGATWYSGDASRNADGLAHAMIIDDWAPGTTLIGFEDQTGGGDEDYDDLAFSLTNVAGSPAVPEPGTLALLGMGLAAMGFFIRRRKA